MNRLLSKSIVRDSSGNVDAAATRAAYDSNLLDTYIKNLSTAETKFKKDYDEAITIFDDELRNYCELRSRWDTLSREYVDAAFDRFQDAGSITKSVLVALCTTGMVNDGKIESFGDLRIAEEMVSLFINENNGSLYSIEKGKVWRR